ncbi:acyl-CoA/acyl-ACP dehydrogenase [Tychonema sp. LEGE 07199]|uniref:acyl-CoA dehydrogenase family protein n=1 Tax=unclassified Tychonema TaxID=2642144 RepID=UPI0018813F98|nr:MULTISPECIES: acyl-CoA dehydrogenase family protein [unclassified Tychonema]MBE9124300.1 acyl-CoA/acyl-ACP dehydrogenase [Tychonema sp. LEGE 07199]MBE9135154.1 acyl-CoA/acyl-ACP dehydrogenase [Tychonema sp. LEGE 07196]
MDFQEILHSTKSYLKECVVPRAEVIDGDSEALKIAVAGLESRSLLALRVPQKWGGAEIPLPIFYEYQELTARYSGALSFLQTQHHSATAMIASSDNEMLKSRYLGAIVAQKGLRLGVGFSHLRRSSSRASLTGNPAVTATPTKDGYLLSGNIPWITGFGLFQKFIVAALLPDNRAVFGVLPFANIQREYGKIAVSEIMQLIAMNSTNTVTATLDNWLLHESEIIAVKPVGWIAENDSKNILNSVPATFGCIRAGLDVIATVATAKDSPVIATTCQKLEQKLDRLKQNFRQSQHSSKAEQLALRAAAIDLAVRCGHAAVVVSGGAANGTQHPAGRVYREALVYTVSGQTKDVMEAALDRIVS